MRRGVCVWFALLCCAVSLFPPEANAAATVPASTAIAPPGVDAVSVQANAAGTAPAATAIVPAGVDPVTLVDPLIGTSGVSKENAVDDFPGADVPFGMVQWSPDTPSNVPGGGYGYSDTAITGFSLTHLSGAGCGVFGDFRFMPTVGAVVDPANAQAPFAHIAEDAHPGSYTVTFTQPAITTQLSVTARTGLGAFTFPAGAAGNVLINTSSDQAGVSAATFRRVNAHEISGSATSGALCGMPDVFTVYLDAQFDRDFIASGTWDGSRVMPGSSAVAGPQTGGYVRFDTTRNRTVKVKVSVSWVSVDGARANIAAEGTSWNLADVRASAEAAWRRALGHITIAGATYAQARIFNTALYHAFLHPNIFSDADGAYRGFDDEVHHVRPGHVQYANFSDWDTYRTQTPLIALLVPQQMSDMIQSLVNAAKEGGWLPRWPLANTYTGVMAGDSVDPLIAGAYAFGAHDFDTATALAAMVKGATVTPRALAQGFYIERPGLDEYLQRGYVVNVHTTSVSPVPNGASETLEYALDDFAIARFARAAGAGERTQREFMRRSQNWTKLFDREDGLILPRDGDGAFIHSPIGPNGQSGFQEGNAWQYTWMIPQNLGGLVDALGGRLPAIARLDRFFTYVNAGQTQPYAWLGNEPSLVSPWTYLYAGDPSGEERVVRRALLSIYTDSPAGIAGNDDLGTMSAWFVWNAIGLYPVTPSVPLLLVGSPLFAHIEVTSDDGRHIAIDAPQAAVDAPYVQRLRVNGTPTQRSWLYLPSSGTLRLDFELGPVANTRWGVGRFDVPPSFGAAPLELPAATSAAFAPTAPVTLAAGSSAAANVTLTNAFGTDPATVSWTAQVPPELSLSPANGTLRAAARGSTATALAIGAAASAPAGLYDIAIAGRAANGAPLARAVIFTRITTGGRPAPVGYIANFSDDTVTAIDPRTRATGKPIHVGSAPGGLALTPDGTRLYVANQGSANVSVIDTATDTVRATIGVGQVPAGIRVAPDGRTVWVANYGDNTAQAIDVATGVASAPIPVGIEPEGVVVTRDAATVYVVDNGSNSLTPIDARTRTAGKPIAVGRRPLAIALSPDGTRLFVGNTEGDSVTVVSTAAGSAIATIPVGKTPQGVGISPDGRRVFVANSGSSSVTPIDAKTLAAGAPIAVGSGPFDVDFSADGTTAFVVNTADNDCVPIDVATGATAAPIALGSFPIAITLPR